MAVTQLLLAARAKLADFTLGDNAVNELTLNQNGRLRVSSKGGLYADSSATLAAVGDTLSVDVSDSATVTFHVKNTGTLSMTSGVYFFEGSIDSTNGTDGTWFSIQGSRTNANGIESNIGLLLGPGTPNAYAWKASVNGVKWFRIRCVTATSANTAPVWTVIRGAYAAETSPAIPTHAVTGSGTFTTAGTVTNTPTSGTSFIFLGTAVSTNSAVIKTSVGNIMEISLFNPTAATVYVKFYSTATAPTAGTGSAYLIIPVAAGAAAFYEFGATGKRFPLGIGYTTVANAAATDATAIAAGMTFSLTYI